MAAKFEDEPGGTQMRSPGRHLWIACWLIAVLPAHLLAAPASDGGRCPGPDTAEGLACREAAVRDLLQTWVVAWAEADVETYLDLYDEGPMQGPDEFQDSRDALRREQLLAQQNVVLTLELESMGIDEDGNLDVVFVQNYRSSSRRSALRKQLFLSWHGAALKIRREVVLD